MSSIGIATLGMFNQGGTVVGGGGGAVPYPVITPQDIPLVTADFVGIHSFGDMPTIDYIGLKSIKQNFSSVDVKVKSIKQSDYVIKIKSVRVK